MNNKRPFHLAFPVNDIGETAAFYTDVLGCSVGRRSDRWIDFDFFGNQITAHVIDGPGKAGTNDVDGDQVPVPHFGAILGWDDWHELADKLRAAGIDFVIEPRIRFREQVGEQATLFFYDPSGNALEFKSFKDESRVFASD
jgi:extradiol dioxygenase family protein